jgi:hypothetical protein
MQLLAAMAPPGGGRNPFSGRITAIFSPVVAGQPGDATLKRIFTSVLATRLSEFNDEVGGVHGCFLSERGRGRFFLLIASRRQRFWF